MNETIALLQRASEYIAASVRTVVVDGEEEPATEGDAEAHDLACELAHEAARLTSVIRDTEPA
jgi:hypothetical protein